MRSCEGWVCLSLLSMFEHSGEFPIVEVAVPVDGCAFEHYVHLTVIDKERRKSKVGQKPICGGIYCSFQTSPTTYVTLHALCWLLSFSFLYDLIFFVVVFLFVICNRRQM
jgi:hypothetical protein